jgi:hypothetical protein
MRPDTDVDYFLHELDRVLAEQRPPSSTPSEFTTPTRRKRVPP